MCSCSSDNGLMNPVFHTSDDGDGDGVQVTKD